MELLDFFLIAASVLLSLSVIAVMTNVYYIQRFIQWATLRDAGTTPNTTPVTENEETATN